MSNGIPDLIRGGEPTGQMLIRRLSLPQHTSVILDAERDHGPVSLRFQSPDQLIRWFDEVVLSARTAGAAYRAQDELQSLQADARSLFQKVFGIELK